MIKGFDTTGQILLISGVGDSLGTVIGETDLDEVLGSMFSAEAGMAVAVSWLEAALLHLTIRSISVAAIAASVIALPMILLLSVFV